MFSAQAAGSDDELKKSSGFEAGVQPGL